jgi:hypothetical protein
LKIPTNKKVQEMKPPEGALGEKLQKNCQGLKVLLVDERSLIVEQEELLLTVVDLVLVLLFVVN